MNTVANLRKGVSELLTPIGHYGRLYETNMMTSAVNVNTRLEAAFKLSFTSAL